MEHIISINNLSKRFSMGESYFTALDNISLEISRGEFSGIVGPSGSGKTSLLNIIGSLDKPSDGEVFVLGENIQKQSQKQAALLRNRKIGFIFQTYNLFPAYTVYENIEFTLLLQKKNSSERRKAVLDALEWVGMLDKASKKPNKLSGGECQRVSIARAMVKKPELVIADEPTANLDTRNTHNILKTMQDLNREFKTTFLFSTHDEKVMKYLNRIITLEDGKIVNDSIQNPKVKKK